MIALRLFVHSKAPSGIDLYIAVLVVWWVWFLWFLLPLASPFFVRPLAEAGDFREWRNDERSPTPSPRPPPHSLKPQTYTYKRHTKRSRWENCTLWSNPPPEVRVHKDTYVISCQKNGVARHILYSLIPFGFGMIAHTTITQQGFNVSLPLYCTCSHRWAHVICPPATWHYLLIIYI